jgi:hypothetical protein
MLEFVSVLLTDGRAVILEKSVADKVLARMVARKLHDEQITLHMRQAGMGPRSVAGSQFAPWIGKNTPKKKRNDDKDDGIIYSV